MTTATDGPTRAGTRPSLGEQMREARAEAREIGAQVGDIATDLRDLGRLEAQLLQAEMKHQAMLAVRAVVWGVVAAILAALLLVFAFTALMYTLAEFWLELWVAAWVTAGVALVLALIGGALAYARAKQIHVMPRRTMQTLKEDVKWARRLISSQARSMRSGG